ncbi:c-type cytochrome [Nitrosophilus labii]|uniref:c-type cytochrome n=1 Tax=Nitrosophilus labii TaxID=2706014 RepID=UPI001656C5A5|nr:c-type cytochrome [Nitrosophilus labii]
MRKILWLFAIVSIFLIVGCSQKPEEKNSLSKVQTKEQSKVTTNSSENDIKLESKGKESYTKIDKLDEKRDVEKAAESSTKENSTESKTDIDGAKLYAKCAGCHGKSGEKRALGKSLPIGGMAIEELVGILKEYRAGKLNKYGMGSLMSSQVKNSSDEEIEALSQYISKLK